MDKKTMLKVFGEAFLRSMIVLMAVVIVGFGAFFLIKVNGDKKLAADASTEQTSTYSEDELQAMLDAENAEDSAEDNSGETMAEAGASEQTSPDEPATEEITTEEVTTEEITTEELTTEEVTTEEVTTEQQNISSTDKKILVLNSTKTNGLASKWMNKLSGDGYTNIDKGNYSATHDAQTVIYVPQEGMGLDLLPYFSNAVIQVGSLDSGIDVSTAGVEIFIVIGSNDVSVQ